MNSKILKEGVKELPDDEFEKQKEEAVRKALIADLDSADGDDEEVDVPTEMERLIDADPLLKNASKRLGDTPKKGRTKFGDLTVEFEPSGK